MANGFAWRVCLVGCIALLAFAVTHSPNFGHTRTVTRSTVINRNETPPDGTITRGECSRAKGMTINQVIYRWGLPKGFDRRDAYFDYLAYPLTVAPSVAMECSLYFDSEDRVFKVSIDV